MRCSNCKSKMMKGVNEGNPDGYILYCINCGYVVELNWMRDHNSFRRNLDFNTSFPGFICKIIFFIFDYLSCRKVLSLSFFLFFLFLFFIILRFSIVFILSLFVVDFFVFLYAFYLEYYGEWLWFVRFAGQVFGLIIQCWIGSVRTVVIFRYLKKIKISRRNWNESKEICWKKDRRRVWDN
jgi:hypothetical protein